MPLLDRIFTDGRCWSLSLSGVGYHQRFLPGKWEVIQPAEEGKLEVSYRWFPTCKDAEDWCLRNEAMLNLKF